MPDTDAVKPIRTKPVRLILIDHLPGFREHLRQSLQRKAHVSVVGEGRLADDVYSGRVPTEVDVAVIDADLPDCESFEVVQWLAAHHPRVAALTLSYYDWDSCLVGARAAGAKGVLLRSEPTEELVQSIEKAARGSIFTRGQVQRVQEWDRAFGRILRSLRPREWEVIWLLVDCLSNQAISRGLDLSENTVEKLTSTIMNKFDMKSRSQLIALVHREHMIVLRCLERSRLLTLT